MSAKRRGSPLRAHIPIVITRGGRKEKRVLVADLPFTSTVMLTSRPAALAIEQMS